MQSSMKMQTGGKKYTKKQIKYNNKYTNKYNNKYNNKYERLSNKERISLITSKEKMTLKDFNKTYIINDKFFKIYLLSTEFLYENIHNFNIKADTQNNNELRKHYIGLHTGYKYYKTLFYLTNRFENTDVFINKGYLFFNIKKYYENYYTKFLPEMYVLNTNSNYKLNNIYIARIVNLDGGEGISYITDEKSFIETKQLLYKVQDDIMISQYINNPLLFNGKKSHLRCYFMITLINKVFNTYLLDTGSIITALLPYKKSDYGNKDIHDTHYKSTYSEILFPEKLYENTTIKNEEDYIKVYNKMCYALNFVSRIALMNVNLYPNAINSYEIYGTDFLITDDHEAFLLEINGYFTSYGGSSNKLLKTYFKWINDVVLIPTFTPEITIPISRSNTPIFTSKIK